MRITTIALTAVALVLLSAAPLRAQASAALSAMTAHLVLEKEGYVLNPF